MVDKAATASPELMMRYGLHQVLAHASMLSTFLKGSKHATSAQNWMRSQQGLADHKLEGEGQFCVNVCYRQCKMVD